MKIYIRTSTPTAITTPQKTNHKQKSEESFSTFSASVPYDEIFSNQFLEDLDKLWELRHYIPDPTKIEFNYTNLQ